MNTATRALVAFFAPVLVVGTAVAATSASASAAPGTVEATPASVCGALPHGDFADYDDGKLGLLLRGHRRDERGLPRGRLCRHDPRSTAFPANGVVTSPSTTFYCVPALIN